MLHRTTTILSIGGLDPSGCAGVLADVRMLHTLGAHSATLLTCITAQSRRQHGGSEATPLAQLRRQWRYLLKDAPIAGIKIGAVANPAQAEWLSAVLPGLGVPIVFDPVLNSSAGGPLGQVEAARQLMSIADISTPNLLEVQALYGENWRQQLPGATLVTGTDSADQQELIQHQLYVAGREKSWTIQRRPGQFRGTGCLLASALTAYLVAGHDVTTACAQAFAQVDSWLAHARHFADGIHLPQPPA